MIIRDQVPNLNSNKGCTKKIKCNLKERIIIEWTYNSNAIEGNSLTLRETKLILEDGLTIKGKPLKEHLEAINHKDAIEFIEKLLCKRVKVTPLLIRQIHSVVLTKIDDKEAGKYRNVKSCQRRKNTNNQR